MPYQQKDRSFGGTWQPGFKNGPSRGIEKYFVPMFYLPISKKLCVFLLKKGLGISLGSFKIKFQAAYLNFVFAFGHPSPILLFGQ